MKIRSILLCLLFSAIVAPAITPSAVYGIARADQLAMPRSQAEFDQFAARLDSASETERAMQLNLSGNAFDNGEARLFWFTDLDAARAQAKIENKPILSLRLLGNLSDEFSCANSRLFRVLLYPNAAVNRQLREKFVLHWSSERPVPVVTIDMGDGRVMKRTLTGNSAHYLLNSDGQPLDVLPGLYAPAEFAAWLENGANFASDWSAMNVDSRPKMLGDWHRGRLTSILNAHPNAKVINPGEMERATELSIARNPLVTGAAINRMDANSRYLMLSTVSKSIMERSILNSIAPDGGFQLPVPSIGNSPIADDISWSDDLFRPKIAGQPVTFDSATRARIIALQSVRGEVAKQLIRTLEDNVARDTLSNRRNMEPAIHAYFVNVARPDFAQLNRAIYDKLFLTPASDPWLGLKDDAAFVALQNGGVVQSQPDSQRVAQTP